MRHVLTCPSECRKEDSGGVQCGPWGRGGARGIQLVGLELIRVTLTLSERYFNMNRCVFYRLSDTLTD